MPASSQNQSDFLGGEWSKLALGRSDLPEYRTALARCLNAVPVEEGAWLRRTGTQRLLPSYGRQEAKLKLFQSSASCAFALEFTPGSVRIWSNVYPIFTNDPRTISAASYSGFGFLTVTLDDDHGWDVGDQVMLMFGSTFDPFKEGGCRGRVLNVIEAPATDELMLGNDLDQIPALPLFISGSLVGATIMRVLRFDDTPWTADLDKVRVVQAEQQAVILQEGKIPQLMEVDEPAALEDPVFTLDDVTFLDGPYLDPQGTVELPETGTVSATTGTVTFTPQTTTFDANDVGRLVRLFSEPAAWSSVTSYAVGDTVKYDGKYWKAINTGAYAALNTNIPPKSLYYAASGNSAVFWVAATQAASWAWGVISTQASTTCDIVLTTDLILANGLTVSTWALGVFKLGQYPSCGIYHEGRLFLGGAVRNRFDASEANQTFSYSPSDQYQNVFDTHALAETLNAKEINPIQWMELDHAGVLMGTETAEWLVSASDLSDPLTPTSVQAKSPTKYGSKNAEPRRCGMALVFIHRYGRRMYEYLSDAYSGKYSGKPLNERAKHMTTKGIVEMAYQEENNPVIWARDSVGSWIGCTYRRVSRFVTESPIFYAWHRQRHGSGGTIASLCVVPAENGVSDRLYLSVVEDSGECFIEIMRPLPDPEEDE